MKPRLRRRVDGFFGYEFSDQSVKAFTSTSRFDASLQGATDRHHILDLLGIFPSQMVAGLQVHRERVQIVSQTQGGRGALDSWNALRDTDGLITSMSHLALSVVTADCLPILLYEPNQKVISALHCGWRSLRLGIIQDTLQMLTSQLDGCPRDLEVVFGPSLQECDFEVGHEFLTFFPHKYFRAGVKQNKYFFDSHRLVADILIQAGCRSENMLNTNLSTIQEVDSCFSYRRQGQRSGRMLSLIWQETL